MVAFSCCSILLRGSFLGVALPLLLAGSLLSEVALRLQIQSEQQLKYAASESAASAGLQADAENHAAVAVEEETEAIELQKQAADLKGVSMEEEQSVIGNKAEDAGLDLDEGATNEAAANIDAAVQAAAETAAGGGDQTVAATLGAAAGDAGTEGVVAAGEVTVEASAGAVEGDAALVGGPLGLAIASAGVSAAVEAPKAVEALQGLSAEFQADKDEVEAVEKLAQAQALEADTLIDMNGAAAADSAAAKSVAIAGMYFLSAQVCQVLAFACETPVALVVVSQWVLGAGTAVYGLRAGGREVVSAGSICGAIGSTFSLSVAVGSLLAGPWARTILYAAELEDGDPSLKIVQSLPHLIENATKNASHLKSVRKQLLGKEKERKNHKEHSKEHSKEKEDVIKKHKKRSKENEDGSKENGDDSFGKLDGPKSDDLPNYQSEKHERKLQWNPLAQGMKAAAGMASKIGNEVSNVSAQAVQKAAPAAAAVASEAEQGASQLANTTSQLATQAQKEAAEAAKEAAPAAAAVASEAQQGASQLANSTSQLATQAEQKAAPAAAQLANSTSQLINTAKKEAVPTAAAVATGAQQGASQLATASAPAVATIANTTSELVGKAKNASAPAAAAVAKGAQQGAAQLSKTTSQVVQASAPAVATIENTTSELVGKAKNASAPAAAAVAKGAQQGAAQLSKTTSQVVQKAKEEAAPIKDAVSNAVPKSVKDGASNIAGVVSNGTSKVVATAQQVGGSAANAISGAVPPPIKTTAATIVNKTESAAKQAENNAMRFKNGNPDVHTTTVRYRDPPRHPHAHDPWAQTASHLRPALNTIWKRVCHWASPVVNSILLVSAAFALAEIFIATGRHYPIYSRETGNGMAIFMRVCHDIFNQWMMGMALLVGLWIVSIILATNLYSVAEKVHHHVESGASSVTKLQIALSTVCLLACCSRGFCLSRQDIKSEEAEVTDTSSEKNLLLQNQDSGSDIEKADPKRPDDVAVPVSCYVAAMFALIESCLFAMERPVTAWALGASYKSFCATRILLGLLPWSVVAPTILGYTPSSPYLLMIPVAVLAFCIGGLLVFAQQRSRSEKATKVESSASSQ